jgi:iron complex transport system ATP-binding protein
MGLLRRLARDANLAIVVSTHDLELALRMADTLWLVAPGGKLHTGTPEDIILDGSLAEAFQAENIRFQPEERAFRLAINTIGRAAVRGAGLHAVLAAAVLEREGYEIVADGIDSDCAFSVSMLDDSDMPGLHSLRPSCPGSARWEVVIEGQCHTGGNFASLAEFVRRRNV